MARKIFVDTDVIIDLFTDRAPFAAAAASLFELNERGVVSIYISAVSINNVYYVVRRYLKHKKAVQVISDLLEITEVAGTTKAEIQHALMSNFKDFEDGIQHATTHRITGVDAIITRNVKDYRESKLAVLTAANYLKSIQG